MSRRRPLRLKNLEKLQEKVHVEGIRDKNSISESRAAEPDEDVVLAARVDDTVASSKAIRVNIKSDQVRSTFHTTNDESKAMSTIRQTQSNLGKRKAPSDHPIEAKPTSANKHAKLSKTVDVEVIRIKNVVDQLGAVQKSQNIVQGVLIEDLKVGSGSVAIARSKVRVHYKGSLKSTGKLFDASTNKPFTFRLGAGEVIRGWDVGISGMKVGGRRRLTIPPQMAYGKSGSPPVIPPNATLVFEVDLLSV